MLFSVVVFIVESISRYDEGNNNCLFGETVSIVVVTVVVEIVVVVVEVVDWFFVVEVVVGRGVGRSTCSTSRGSSRSRSCLYPVKMRSVYHV